MDPEVRIIRTSSVWRRPSLYRRDKWGRNRHSYIVIERRNRFYSSTPLRAGVIGTRGALFSMCRLDMDPELAWIVGERAAWPAAPELRVARDVRLRIGLSDRILVDMTITRYVNILFQRCSLFRDNLGNVARRSPLGTGPPMFLCRWLFTTNVPGAWTLRTMSPRSFRRGVVQRDATM